MAKNPFQIKDREDTINSIMNALGSGQQVQVNPTIPAQGIGGSQVTNDYTDKIKEDLLSGGSQNAGTTYTEDDIYNYLRSASAKELVDSNIQLSVARQQAQKNLQTSLAASGLAGSGYGATAGVGINSAYLRGLSDNQATYANAINEINMQEAQDMKAEQELAKQNADNSVLAVYEAVQNATNDQQIKDALALGEITYEDGVLGGAGYDRLTDEQKRYLQYYINLTKSYNETPIDFAIGADGNNLTDVQDAYRSLAWFNENAPMKEGLVVELQGANGSKKYVTYSHGRWVMTNASAYNSASNENKSSIYGYGPAAQITGYFSNYR